MNSSPAPPAEGDYDRHLIAKKAGPDAPPDPADRPLLWSSDRVARALDISRRTLERELAAGRFPRPDVRIGRMPRWKPETVSRWIDSQR